jgi:4-hydroxy-2-oxoglutarate aldolase
MSERECLEVVETTREAVPDHLTLIVGAGQQHTRATIEEIRSFASAGAQAALVITPGFYRAEMTQPALKRYYEQVADASPVPLLLYNVPQFTGITLAPETVASLSFHENIIGIKDSSGDVLNLGEKLRLVRDDFAVLTGHGAALYASLCAGACGAILAIACVAPEAAVAVYRAYEAGDHERARDLQRKLAAVVRGVASRYGIGGLKAALDARGYLGGGVRAPLHAPDADARQEIARVLEESGLFVEAMRSEDESRSAGALVK